MEGKEGKNGKEGKKRKKEGFDVACDQREGCSDPCDG